MIYKGSFSPPLQTEVRATSVSVEEQTYESNIPNSIGNYRIAEKIGRGSFSQVRVAYNIITQERLCVKIVSKLNIASSIDRIQCEREVKILAAVSHPNIIKFIDFHEDENYFYIFQEISDGATLLKFISLAENPLSENLARQIFRQIATALYYLHSMGIYHRDIKLENILINKDMTIKLIDFGFCTYSDPDSLLKTICGSVKYLAPECIQGKPYFGSAADIWSSGVVLYSLLTKKMPFNGQNQPQIMEKVVSGNYDIPNHLSIQCLNLIRKILVVDPLFRLTIEEIIQHPWLTETVQSSALPDNILRKVPQCRSFQRSDCLPHGSFAKNGQRKTSRKLIKRLYHSLNNQHHYSTSQLATFMPSEDDQ